MQMDAERLLGCEVYKQSNMVSEATWKYYFICYINHWIVKKKEHLDILFMNIDNILCQTLSRKVQEIHRPVSTVNIVIKILCYS